MAAEPADRGYAAEPIARFGIVYEAQYGGSGCGMYVVVDRVLGVATAWRIHVDPRDSNRMRQERLDRFRELVAGENERWRAIGAARRAQVTERPRHG
ncbi:MAG: hypothetical protein ACRDJC_10550 [Thermomicrobiales bacterium]